jgi:hypothetical protein
MGLLTDRCVKYGGEQVSIVMDSIFLGGNLICLSPFIMGSYGPINFLNISFDPLLLDY